MNLEDRLGRLERSVRRWRLGAVVAAGLALATGALKPVPREVEARNFVVRDDEGKVRAVLGLIEPREGDPGDSPAPHLSLYGPRGEAETPAVRLTVSPLMGGAAFVRGGRGGPASNLLGGGVATFPDGAHRVDNAAERGRTPSSR